MRELPTMYKKLSAMAKEVDGRIDEGVAARFRLTKKEAKAALEEIQKFINR
jgi:hypothetical protein